jgi:valyl-tRNA synthetase
VADPVVDRAFGTGAVKITPAHDHDDYETGRRHRLPSVTVLDDRGRVTHAGGPYAGLDRFEARARIVADLETAGDLEGSTPHDLLLGRCQRSNDVIEPLLKTQWFVRTASMAAAALEATRAGRTRIHPGRFEKTWENWLTGIRDWNVSRQLWWGHRIPAWYCPDGHVTVSEEPDGPMACESCGCPAQQLSQDPDIFDTWFSSGLWPFSTLGWPEPTRDLEQFYPGSVMETGYDILFFWVARMMMLGIELAGDVPFRTVYLSGLIRDPEGQKMSKTKGNVVDPLSVIDETGADALRFALIHGATPGLDQRFGRAKLDNARNFANKLWNATRFVLGARPATLDPSGPRRAPDAQHLGPGERWIRSRLAATIVAADRALAELNLAELTRLLYEAIWNDLCDWGLELAKVRLGDPGVSANQREATWWTLVEALDGYLRLLHPVMPFVTEALWAALPHDPSDPPLLIVASWPAPGEVDEALEAEFATITGLVRGIRNARAEARVDPAAWLPTEVVVPQPISETVDLLRPAIERLARARPIVRRRERSTPAGDAGDGRLAVIVGAAEAMIELPRAEDDARAADRARLERELAAAERLLATARARLANAAFLAKAPAAVVEGARASESELAATVARLRERLGA